MTIKASPHDVCEALMDSEKPSQFTGAPTIIDREIGGSFTAYAGNLTGTILELVPDNKIVQSWQASDDDWESCHCSAATFSLEAFDGDPLNLHPNRGPRSMLLCN